MTDLTVHATRPDDRIGTLLGAKGIVVQPLEATPEECERFVLSQRLAVDRYTAHDFLQAISDKRLFVNAMNLSESFLVPVIVIEGEDLYDIRGFHPSAIRGALSALVVQYGCSLLRTESDVDTAALIAMMAAHEQQGVPEISLHPKRKATSLPDMQRRVVEMLPGVGLIGARALLQRFGSVNRIANCTLDELRSVKGIGEHRAREIINVLRADYESVDSEADVEDAVDYDPSILFRQPVVRVARQHVLSDEHEKFVLDLVCVSETRRDLYVVELKRDDLTDGHFEQLREYLDRAERSELLRSFIENGYRLRGILASPGECKVTLSDPRIEVRRMSEGRVIAALRKMRKGAGTSA